MYTKQQFIEDVKKEAIALRNNAKPAELKKLNAALLFPENVTGCIYGQMTGNCLNIRASKLIVKCCPRYFNMPENERGFFPKNIQKIRKYVNGEKIKGVKGGLSFMRTRGYHVISHFSAIETYILYPKAKINNLIAYLRGETNELNL